MKGIKRAIDDCIVRREDLFIIGKVTLENKNDPEKHLRNILDYANISYLDLYLDVLPYSKDHIKNSKENHFKPISIYEFWQKMEELVKKGLVKSLGVCNYNIQCLSNLISFCQIRPVVNEIEFNPYNYQIFKNIKEFYDKEQIAIIAYNPMVMSVESRIWNKYHNDKLNPFKEKIFIDLALKYAKTVGQIILNWYYCLGIIPIPGTNRPLRIMENLYAIQFKLENRDVERICGHFLFRKPMIFIDSN